MGPKVPYQMQCPDYEPFSICTAVSSLPKEEIAFQSPKGTWPPELVLFPW